MFASIARFAAASHRVVAAETAQSNAGAAPLLQRPEIPTALVFAGGVNSADHTKTFPNLVVSGDEHRPRPALGEP